MKIRKLVQLIVIAGSLAACGSSSTSSDAGTTGSPDAGTAVDAGSTDAGMAAKGMNNCTDADYMDMSTGSNSDRMIMMNTDGTFDMPCMTIAAGQSVMFMWDLATYPIAPGLSPSHKDDPAGTTPNPIKATNSGQVYSVTFPNAGFYPFYVPGHDATMLGVIQVK